MRPSSGFVAPRRTVASRRVLGVMRMIRRLSRNARRVFFRTLSFSVLAIGACSPTLADSLVDVGRGPVLVHVPTSYDPGVPTPLVILLHGYSSNSAAIGAFFNIAPVAEAHGLIYAAPDGTIDAVNNRFWNATDACCDFNGSGVDDSGYLRSLVEAIAARYNIDDRRVYFAGLSNGGFMSYRMACDHADLVAGIVSVSGATFNNRTDCTPTEPVHVLEIHGTNDSVILYLGNFIFGVPYPSAIQSVETWAGYNGCGLTAVSPSGSLDLDANILGAETTVRQYPAGCPRGGSAELWTVNGGPHVLSGTPDFGELVVQHLLTHQKPQSNTVPGVSEWGLVSLVFLLVISGTLILRWISVGGVPSGRIDAQP